MKLALLLLISSLALSAANKQVVVISDIHFNPLANPALAAQLAAVGPDRWETILSADNLTHQKYGEDTDWPLLASLVRELQSHQPKPLLIILTGDVLPHKFQEKFTAALAAEDRDAFRSFVEKTFDFVALELKKASGNVPLIYTPGNNDAECGDYALQPNGPFLAGTEAAVANLAIRRSQELSDWPTYGDFKAQNPLAKHHVILAVNSSFWSRRYKNACGSSSDDPGSEVIKWLTAQLADARKNGDKVWLVYHIPPGIDGHSSAVRKEVVPFWQPQYAKAFEELLDQYRNVIELNLCGHTHLDDIRLVKTQRTTTLILINPGISPNVNQNPAFHVLTFDRKARLQDFETQYVPDLATLTWKTEYQARSAYGLRKLDTKNYRRLYSEVGGTGSLADKWKLFYSVSRPEGLLPQKDYYRSIYCAAGNTSPESFENCLKFQ